MSAEGDWRSPQFRQSIRAKLEEIIRQAGQTANVVDLENQIFIKAKSREEYLRLTAKLIRFFQENSAKKAHTPMQQTVVGQTVPVIAPDPITSLQSLTSSQNSGDMLGNIAMSVPVSTLSDGSVMNVTSVSSVPVTISMNATSVNQLPQMNQSQQLVQLLVNQMLLPNAGTGQVSNQQRTVMPSNIQMIQRMRQPANQQPVQVPQTIVDGSYYAGQNIQNTPSHAQYQTNVTQPFHNSPSVMIGGQSQSTLSGPHSQLNQIQSTPVMTPSPSNYVPSPSQGLLTSPMSVGMINQRAPFSNNAVASPSSLNTPVMVQNQSPIMRPLNEDQAYLDKLKQLSKYIEPLRNMITRIDRDERKKDLHKINNLLEIISDPNRRCSMETLLKCEQVLEKMEFKIRVGIFTIETDNTSTLSQSQVTNHSKIQDHNIGQPLLDAVKLNIKKPFFNHTLLRTFGSAVAALTNSSYRIPSPPPKHSKIEEPEVPDVLQGEIARLDHRFKVQMDPLQHSGSKTISLICRLDDVDLPSVPSIAIHVPVGYPDVPPQCRIDDLDGNECSSSSKLSGTIDPNVK
ncbi:mediator of RNA polymerase II transcription subunit 15-like protein [Leptotrombidium deliense]|uniref:Mediator of RNA polymerase II transcription subunit 15 n=1 Tax=Leptotrombidium deliense TaxID=299467 RepID=A0A443SP40_9ACAR|nr:mediator of RNA polymerase II transcription subunit 15-like protein [Leptotrombidium deliense]